MAGLSQESALGPSVVQQQQHEPRISKLPSDILDARSHDLTLEKSNIMMLGPTGSGKIRVTFFIELCLVGFPFC